MLQGDDLIQFLGLKVGSPEIERLREDLDPTVGVEQDDDAFFLSFPVSGLELLFDREGVLNVVFLFADGEEGAQQYRGMLPENIDFSMDRESIRRILGEPQESGGGDLFLNQEVLPWDKFYRSGWSLYVRYSGPLRSVRRVALIFQTQNRPNVGG